MSGRFAGGVLGLGALLVGGVGGATAQEALPVLHATSRVVDVRDGGRLLEGIWRADPSNPLDVYATRRTTRPKTVTFLSDAGTDRDSLSFVIEAGASYDFIVLLDGVDSCRTRILADMQGCRRPDGGESTTVPIEIRGGKLHVQGRINDSEPLDLIFDTGADIHVLYPSGRAKGAGIRLDADILSSGTGGAVERRMSRDNHLEVGALEWDHEPVLFVETQADGADGIVGYPAFEDEIVVIDFDRMTLTVRETLPEDVAEYTRTAMHFQGSLTMVEAGLRAGDAPDRGMFVLDTAGSGALMANREFAALHRLHETLPRLGRSTSRGVGHGSIRNAIVRLPELTLAGFALHDVPMHVELPGAGEGDPPRGTLCMEVLSRFDTILDYARYEAYFRPAAGFDAPFVAPPGGPPRAVLVSAGALVALLAGAAWLRARRRRPAA